MTHSKPLVIVGTGLAGYNLAKEWRKLNTERPLILITQDDGHFYSKPQLSTTFTLNKTPEQLVINTCSQMQQQLKATIFTYSQVLSIHPDKKTIEIISNTSSHSIEYHQLVLAVGATPRAFGFNTDFPHHYRVNNLVDYSKFIQEIKEHSNLLIIGSGLVGCEFAHDLSKLNKKIDLITPDPYALYQLVPEVVGRALQQVLINCGVQWHGGHPIDEMRYEENQIKVSANQQTLSAPAALSAIGLLPSVELAKKANLTIARGICVDAFLETSQPDIFALGDCAEIQGFCYQYVSPLLASARALAQTLEENRTAVTLPPVAISLKVAALPVVVLPPKEEGSWEFDIQDNHIKGLFYNTQGSVVGYVLSGDKTRERQTVHQLLLDNMNLLQPTS